MKRAFVVAFTCTLATTAAVACSDSFSPPTEPDVQLDLQGGPADSDHSPLGQPGHDPRLGVREQLGPPEDLFATLEAGQCVIHYRRGSKGYTPITFNPEVTSGNGKTVPAVLTLRRGEHVGVRAVCQLPMDQQEAHSAVTQVRARMRLPAFKRDSEGNWVLYEPSAAVLLGTASLDGSLLQRFESRFFDLSRLAQVALTGLGPTPLFAAQEDDPPFPPPPDCDWVYNGYDWALDCDDDPIVVTTCQDPDKEYDEAIGQCVCKDGLVDDGQGGCMAPPPDDPPDDPPTDTTCTTDCGGGTDDGGGSDPSGYSLGLTCEPQPVRRGDDVLCTASADGGPLLVTKWEFIPSQEPVRQTPAAFAREGETG